MGEKNEHETLRSYLNETEGTMYAIGKEWEREILAEYDALRAENERLKAEVEGRGNLLLRWLMDNHLGIESDDDTFVPETLECLGMTDEDLESVAESGDY